MSESDETVLFPEQEIEGYKVRPWSLGAVVALAPSIREVIAVCRKEGITEENYEQQVQEKIADILLQTVQHVPKIIATTLAIPEEEIVGMPFPKSAKILIGILKQNVTYIKNSFARM
jgi:hypothetical protein